MWPSRVLRMAVVTTRAGAGAGAGAGAAEGAVARRGKLSTGLVGLEVVPDARVKLIAMYEQTLLKVSGIPAGVPYRESVEQITRHRLTVCQANESEDAIEELVDCGQLEELLEQAQDELTLIELVKGTPIGMPHMADANPDQYEETVWPEEEEEAAAAKKP
jgi:hypothetical protein